MGYEVLKVKASDPAVRATLDAAGLRGYKGAKRVRVTISGRGESQLLHSYWDGGSRSTWRLVYAGGVGGYRAGDALFQWRGNFDTRVSTHDKAQLAALEVSQPLGSIFVEHVEGHREAVYLHVREDDAELIARFKPAPFVLLNDPDDIKS